MTDYIEATAMMTHYAGEGITVGPIPEVIPDVPQEGSFSAGSTMVDGQGFFVLGLHINSRTGLVLTLDKASFSGLLGAMLNAVSAIMIAEQSQDETRQ